MAVPAKKSDPFKTRKTKVETKDQAEVLSPPKDVAEAIDRFRESQEQAKHFEGEAMIYKDKILDYSRELFCKRLFQGFSQSFKIASDESMVTYIVQDSSAGLTEDDVAEIRSRWGERAADDLITKDYASIRFDANVLEANYDRVVAALQSLPEEVLDKLFKPMLMKATPGAIEMAKRHAKTPEEMNELLEQLKIKNYVK